MATNSYSNIKSTSASWNAAVRNFGVVTVMDAKVYDVYDGMDMGSYAALVQGQSGALSQEVLAILYSIDTKFVTREAGEEPETYIYTLNPSAIIDFSRLKANEIIALYLLTTPVATLKYLKTANATQDGPTKTITGGKRNNILVKYGKTARLEMTNALGNAEALEALCGVTVEYFRTSYATTPAELLAGATDVLHVSSDFSGHKTIIGDTFLIDGKTGNKVNAYIIFYDFSPDDIFNLNQDAEGDAAVFDMNGDLNETDILVGDLYKIEDGQLVRGGDADGVVRGMYYSVLPLLDYESNAQVIEDNIPDSTI